MNEQTTVEKIFKLKTVAVVGLSPREERPSNRVAKYLMSQGFEIIPVNPGHDDILGKQCYSSLRDIPVPVDVVDVFRSPDAVPPIVEDAIEIKAKALWLQDGVIHEEAAEKAEKAGLLVVMNDCMLRRHSMLS